MIKAKWEEDYFINTLETFPGENKTRWKLIQGD